jgi:hypothetical protein
MARPFGSPRPKTTEATVGESPPAATTNPSTPKRVVKGAVGLMATGFHGIGTGAAYVREIPLLGPLLIEPIRFSASNIAQGYNETRTKIVAKKTARAQMSPQEAADAALSPDEQTDLRGQAQADAACAPA